MEHNCYDPMEDVIEPAQDFLEEVGLLDVNNSFNSDPFAKH
jgi:hypothetical protein